ncbi:NAD(P)/FAD-dependent oxidoreductase [Gordonia sp. TBRC 11910]|uniref:NAD(P)/FAD-dependent oxidoreductase n=1 Tax=Gordonia asplenii TaxID=2725283 RepID=A0A848KVM5_9ACTN|nr:NAD(P)/FAD-dependent oxidoreductase [Gordonia asplenii]NMO02726.1 NAD(P)/FAD-dependent oxidoreductase [Gordonia asplenii]
MTTATIVGGGPNGLAAAVYLARSGVDVTVLEAADTVGGGVRSSGGIVDGLIHDHCAAFHPMAVGSPFLAGLDLQSRGVRWLLADADCAHPIDGGRAGVLYTSVGRTADGLAADAALWRGLFESTSGSFDTWSSDIMGPLLRVPKHPFRLARFGAPTALPAAVLARAFRTPEGRALFGGVAAHTFRPLNRPLTSAIGLGILTAGHRHGWPVVEGGSGVLIAALVDILKSLGGQIETGCRVESAADLPASDITMYDLAPTAVAQLLGDRLPPRIRKAYRKFRYGPGAFKVDFAIDGPIPWSNPDVGRAGTVHLGGEFAEIAATEKMISTGKMPERPFVLLGQQFLADPSRSAGDINPVYSYAHVPNGFTGDATEAIIGQIERFAPGFRDRIVGTAVRSTTEMSVYNPNYVGGDICTGAKDLPQLVFGPRTTLDPYSLGIAGSYICSAATPPGPGAHGMCGANAAAQALRELGG